MKTRVWLLAPILCSSKMPIIVAPRDAMTSSGLHGAPPHVGILSHTDNTHSHICKKRGKPAGEKTQ